MNKASKRKKAISATSSDSTLPDDLPPEEDPATATIDVTAVEVPEMTEAEQRDRLHLERQIEKAFYLAGKALTELRDRRLYRSTHRTFEQYCKDRFGLSRDTAYLKLSATVVYDNIQKFLPTIGRHRNLPTNE